MNFKNVLLLASTLVYANIPAMTPRDCDLLHQVQSVTREYLTDIEGWNLESWKGFINSNVTITVLKFLDGPFQNQLTLVRPASLKDNFVSQQSVEEAYSYLVHRYEMQTPGYRFTQ